MSTGYENKVDKLLDVVYKCTVGVVLLLVAVGVVVVVYNWGSGPL